MSEDTETREGSPPDDGSDPESAEQPTESNLESTAESEAEPDSQSQADSKPEPKPDSQADSKPEPEPSDSVADAEPATADDSGGPAPESDTPESEPSTERSEKSADEVYCASCGEIIKQAAEICPECGVRQREPAPASQEKNPGLAAVASFFFAGLGQIYNGQIAKGIILMLVQSVNVLLMFVLVGFLTYPIVWIYGIWDAYTTAEKINSGEITV